MKTCASFSLLLLLSAFCLQATSRPLDGACIAMTWCCVFHVVPPNFCIAAELSQNRQPAVVHRRATSLMCFSFLTSIPRDLQPTFMCCAGLSTGEVESFDQRRRLLNDSVAAVSDSGRGSDALQEVVNAWLHLHLHQLCIPPLSSIGRGRRRSASCNVAAPSRDSLLIHRTMTCTALV